MTDYCKSFKTLFAGLGRMPEARKVIDLFIRTVSWEIVRVISGI